jgi:hypothetical protein
MSAAVALLVLALGSSASRWLLSATDIDVVRQAASTRLDALWHTGATHGLAPVALLLARLSMRLFGESRLGVTTHTAAAFGAMVACAYLFVRRRTPRACAWWTVLVLAAAVPVRTIYDLRAYTLMGATTAAALVCWQRSAERNRLPWQIGLALALAFAAYLQPVGIFVVLCVVTAIAFQAIERRRVEFVAVALVGLVLLGAVAFVALRGQQLSTAAATRLTLKTPFHMLAAIRATYILTLGFVGPALFFLTVTALFRSNNDEPSSIPRMELAAATALVLLPIWAYAPAERLGFDLTVSTIFPVLLGCSYWIGWLGHRAARGRRSVELLWTAVLLCAVVANLTVPDDQIARWELRDRQGRFVILQWEDRIAPEIPIVIPDRDSYDQLTYYAPKSVSERLVHVHDRDGLTELRRRHRDFYVFEGSFRRSPLFEWLAAERPEITEGRSWTLADFWGPHAQLYRVKLP